MILGKIIGKVNTNYFQFQVTNPLTKKLQFIQIPHSEYGYVLGQILELERNENGMIAQCNVFGYKDADNRIKQVRTPFSLGTEVLEAEDELIKSVIRLDGEGGFIGYLEGKKIPIMVDLQKILTKHLCVLAKSGAGKSYFCGVLLEEIMDKRVPLLIIDPHGEYATLRFPNDEEKSRLEEHQLEPKGYGANIQEYGDPKTKEDLRPLKLNEKLSLSELMTILPLQLSNTQEAMLFSAANDLETVDFDGLLMKLGRMNTPAKWSIMETISYLKNLELFSTYYTDLNELICPGKCSIINLKGISPEIQDIIVYRLLKELFQARKEEKIPPFFCVIEEAHLFVPEKGFGKAKSSEVVRLISSEGRKFGLGLCVISQRPALVQKTVLAQCSTQIIMKITNPNDLKAITNSIEGITSETESEIQNLATGSALVCGVVDRPLVVNVRPRKSQHGGKAVDILKAVEERELEEKNFVEESQNYEEKGILPLIKPRLSIKDLKLMATLPIEKITIFLIPAVFCQCLKNGVSFNILVDKIQAKIIVDPENESVKEIPEVDVNCHFLRKPVFESFNFDVKLDEKINSNAIKEELGKFCSVEDLRDCFIVFHKVEYQEVNLGKVFR